MDDLFEQEELKPVQTASSFGILPVRTGFFEWLASLIHLTKEDQENAGVYLGAEGRE